MWCSLEDSVTIAFVACICHLKDWQVSLEVGEKEEGFFLFTFIDCRAASLSFFI